MDDDSTISKLTSILEELEELDSAAIRVARDKSHRELFDLAQDMLGLHRRFAVSFRAALAVDGTAGPFMPGAPGKG